MNIFQWIRLFFMRQKLQERNRWSKSQLKNHQTKELAALREYAYLHSPFYKGFHSGLLGAPLEKLPVLTKTKLMEHWNEIVTDKSVKLEEVREFLAHFDTFALFKNKYYVSSTGGSTGQKGIFIYNPDEWIIILASYIRSNDLAEVEAGFTRKMKLAVVSSTNLRHQSALFGATLKNSPVSIVERIDSTENLETIVEKLNRFQPRGLTAYSNMAKILAQEQIKGTLKISPEVVFCSSEVLTEEAKKLIRRAWGVDPFNVYAATECAVIASECVFHKLHLFEDLVLVEAVDEQYQPIKPGSPGAKLLATVLYSRTLPLIRYELTDSIIPSFEICKCGKPFGIIHKIEGRSEDILNLRGKYKTLVPIHPNIFHDKLGLFSLDGWQVIQEENNRLRIFIVTLDKNFDDRKIINALTEELLKREVDKPHITVEHTTSLKKTALGKTPLVIALSKKGIRENKL